MSVNVDSLILLLRSSSHTVGSTDELVNQSRWWLDISLGKLYRMTSLRTSLLISLLMMINIRNPPKMSGQDSGKLEAENEWR